MDLEKIYLEEDLFPREITAYEKRDYGYLFYDEMNSNTLFFVVFFKEKPVGMTRCHITDGICRVDYLLVSKKFRNIGVGRSLIHCFVEYCIANQIDKCYLWPDGETAEKIYYEAGFRHIETKLAGRATYKVS